jgi:hypothetical protein
MIVPAKHQHILVGFLMALLMSCIMSFVISVINVGWIDAIASIWLKAWGTAFIIAFPIILLIGPVVRKLAAKLVKH